MRRPNLCPKNKPIACKRIILNYRTNKVLWNISNIDCNLNSYIISKLVIFLSVCIDWKIKIKQHFWKWKVNHFTKFKRILFQKETYILAKYYQHCLNFWNNILFIILNRQENNFLLKAKLQNRCIDDIKFLVHFYTEKKPYLISIFSKKSNFFD